MMVSRGKYPEIAESSLISDGERVREREPYFRLVIYISIIYAKKCRYSLPIFIPKYPSYIHHFLRDAAEKNINPALICVTYIFKRHVM